MKVFAKKRGATKRTRMDKARMRVRAMMVKGKEHAIPMAQKAKVVLYTIMIIIGMYAMLIMSLTL